MSLLFIDGFDHYATADLAKKWTTVSFTPTIVPAGGRRGGGALVATGSSHSVQKTIALQTGLVWGSAVLFTTAPTSTREIMRFMDVATSQIQLQINTNMTISVMRGSTTLGTTTVAAPIGSWVYLELKVVFSQTVGTYELRLNGVNILSATGVDTCNSATVGANVLYVGSSGTGGPSPNFDDMYLLNLSGSTNNDFLGDCRVDTIYPTSDGTYSAGTPSAGSTHYVLVDENPPNTSDYIDLSAVSDRDSYGMGNLDALTASTVYGVQVNAAVWKDDAGAKSAAAMVRSGSTNADGASTALGTSQLYVSQIFEQNPAAAAAWTEATVNSMEAGVVVTA